ncbi:hypothetical protein D8S78_01220 [Natrialba swarupiae]|nr:hypothetical protein [Natrialba swarupiae]
MIDKERALDGSLDRREVVGSLELAAGVLEQDRLSAADREQIRLEVVRVVDRVDAVVAVYRADPDRLVLEIRLGRDLLEGVVVGRRLGWLVAERGLSSSAPPTQPESRIQTARQQTPIR